MIKCYKNRNVRYSNFLFIRIIDFGYYILFYEETTWSSSSSFISIVLVYTGFFLFKTFSQIDWIKWFHQKIHVSDHLQTNSKTRFQIDYHWLLIDRGFRRFPNGTTRHFGLILIKRREINLMVCLDAKGFSGLVTHL